jgi:single-strand DNA-binding protein
MINNAVIMGRLVRDPEERKTSAGKTVCSFCVAVNDDFNKDKTYYIDFIAWDKKAEFVIKYFRKGSMIAVQGKITTRNWEDKNGSKHKAVEIVADAVSFCGDKNEKTSGTSVDVPSPTDNDCPPAESGYREIPDDEVLPF